jgi:hypothetical protein
MGGAGLVATVGGGLWLAAVAAYPLRRSLRALPLLPAGLWGWSGLALSLVLLGVGGWYGAKALAGRGLPPVEMVDITNPFGPGNYLVGRGGSNSLVNGHTRPL